MVSVCVLGVCSLQPKTLAQAKQMEPQTFPTREIVVPRQESPAPQNLPIVGAGWRTEENLPWSQLVRIQEKEGEYIGVIARDYPMGANLKHFRQTGLLNNWNRKNIQLYGYYTHRNCFTVIFVPICKTFHPIGPIDFAQIKVGSQIFDLEGELSYFKVPNVLADALRQASPGQILIRFSPSNSGDLVVRSLGADTVKALKVLYQDVSIGDLESEPKPHPVPTEAPLRSNLPIVDGATWRCNDDVPWSVPVKVNDPFDGDYLAVLDAEFGGGSAGLKTNWSKQKVQFHVFQLGDNAYVTEEIKTVQLKIGDRTFDLTGERNQFAIHQELAAALYSAPLDQVFIRFVGRKGEKVEHRIGNGTIQAWRIVYQVN